GSGQHPVSHSGLRRRGQQNEHHDGQEGGTSGLHGDLHSGDTPGGGSSVGRLMLPGRSGPTRSGVRQTVGSGGGWWPIASAIRRRRSAGTSSRHFWAMSSRSSTSKWYPPEQGGQKSRWRAMAARLSSVSTPSR